MITLRIEHAISDYGLWGSAFDRLAERRRHAGVRRATIRRPIDDPAYLMLDLEFDTPGAATAFATFLEQKVWTSASAAPALAGVPRTQILTVMVSEPDRLSPMR